MLKFGIIGMNEGNGHPYSFSAIFNGYDEDALEQCPYSAIKAYLPAHHQNKKIIPDAQITHIWTQDRQMSQSVASLAKIPNIVDNYEDMIGQVDAVILSRDDPHNHWEMAKPFIDKGMPIYIDKVLAHNLEDMKKIVAATGDDYLIMAGSSSRYTRNIEKAKKEIDTSVVRTIHGISAVTWIRYASHLLDGICYVFGSDAETVQNVGKDGFDIVHIGFKNGLNMVLQVITGLSHPIEFTCYSDVGQEHYKVVFSDVDENFSSYFVGFYRMLETFTEMVKTGKQVLPLSETANVSRIVIAGEMSRNEGGRKVYLEELK